jgi:ABC-type xylose transport system permease subunit
MNYLIWRLHRQQAMFAAAALAVLVVLLLVTGTVTSNVAYVLAAAAAWGGTMSLLVTWWRGPEDALQGGRFGVAFDITGITPIAYAVFAVALGIAAGTILRHVIPAMATTLAGFVLVRGAVGLWLRPRFAAPIRHTFRLVNNISGAPPGAWILSKIVIDPSGRLYDPSSPTDVPAACHAALFSNSAASCLAAHGFRRLVTYQPANRYWTFQAIEFAIFALLAAALVAFACALVFRRDA